MRVGTSLSRRRSTNCSTGNGFCSFMANPGPCDSQIKMYAYDPSIDSCMDFIYSGCGGNPNRFETEKECQTVCNADIFIEEEIVSLPPGKRRFVIEFIKPEPRDTDPDHTCAITNPM
ncbi:kunitz-type serine protease inhibitor homolog beta-bungarotoxin B6 chain isoform X2 [Drosophila willistoni]|uniref:kunitz-type serine protease inhibitor homolog beta-bungarotoxin B6 chain isoform X2 n=1 Tax=Drosophila willistoni TaxID=7260 RepID=UPI000C26CE0D|nr:kunitz-type serine protease inhibitor homolog beta-bungarotoxin B6 chain isoform X2 [Drosophila willistoni]